MKYNMQCSVQNALVIVTCWIHFITLQEIIVTCFIKTEPKTHHWHLIEVHTIHSYYMRAAIACICRQLIKFSVQPTVV